MFSKMEAAFFSFLITILLICVSSLPQSVGSGDTAAVPAKPRPQPVYPVGDVRRCLATLGKGVQRFEVLPGGGWDNLQNRDMGLVSYMNYSLCRTTDDGQYLVPDSVYTIPVKSSRVETYAEMFEHWKNYTSVTSHSINAHAGLTLGHFGISGSYSSEYKHVKAQQYRDKSVTTRIQVRYVRYEAKLEPDTAYMAVFRDRLKKIAAHVTLNRTELARYESQLIVRDFGTHLVTSVDVGAALVQVDQVRAEFVRKYESDTSSVKAAASGSFFSVFNFGGGYSQSTSKTMIDEYKKSRTSSHIETIGGPVYKPLNYTANTWTDSIDNNMVALDRSGDPIYFSINTQTLPDIPEATVFQVYNHVMAAVAEYYKHNIYRGCTKPDSPNFNFQANVDDGTCKPAETNYTFGGVYQTCSSSGYTNLCTNLEQKNPLTGGFSCSQGYEAIMIQTGTKSSTTTRKECHRCWLAFHCCNHNTYTAHAQYTAYWCAASGSVPPNHGFLFGGLFSPMVNNPLTMTKDCPTGFYKLHILADLTVCVSDDYELGYQYSLPFAGFFSCKAGNPLALKKIPATKLKSGDQPSLRAFMLESGPSTYPHECPTGYSQHLAKVDHGCEINFCVEYGALSPQGLPPVQRPPFMTTPNAEVMASETSADTIVFNDDGSLWMTLTEADERFGADNGAPTLSPTEIGTFRPDSASAGSSGGSPSNKNGLSTGGVVAITFFGTLAFVVILTLAVLWVKRRGRHGEMERLR